MHLSCLFSVSIKEPLDFLQSAFIHKSALIRTVKFVEISENGIRYVHVSPGRSSGISFRLLRRTLGGRSTRVNSCATREKERERGDAGVSFIYTSKEAHALSSSSLTLSRPQPRVFSQFSRMGTPQEGPRLLSRQAREAVTPQLHNRRPRRKVHLTSQIHNSLTLCRAKRPAASVPR